MITKPSAAGTVTAPDRIETRIAVGLEEIRVSSDTGEILACLGLGSCIAVSAYDPVARVGAMAHVVLPESSGRHSDGEPGKYADTAIPGLINVILAAGAQKSRTIIKIAGGARIFSNVKEGSLLDIGARNLVAVKQAINDNGLKLAGENTGGTYGRSLLLHIASGRTLVTSAMRDPIEL